MKPALSVIFFTVMGGAGYGVWCLLGLALAAGVYPLAGTGVMVPLGFGFVLVTAGLLASTLHLGRPERAWRALSQWRSSWLSREGIASLMDAGVPLKRPTAGIAMGLILEGSRFAVLSDILGEMSKALTNARAELGEYAPRIETFKIATDKIREVIGTGGKVIREIVEKTGAKVNIEDDGTVKVASNDGEAMKAAIKWIKSIASDPEIGQIYEGTVVKVMEFGAFVNFFGAKDGLVHISQLASARVQKTSDVVKEGDKVKVKLLGFDDRGKTRLSMKVVDQATGEDLEAKQKAEAPAPREAAGE
jgi:polyribonucleotide nucleotidyltransferase